MEFHIPIFYMKFNTGMKKNVPKQTMLFMTSIVLLTHILNFLGTASNVCHNVFCC